MESIKKKSLRLFTIFIIFISLLGTAYSAGHNVVLANQNPDPVSPGNFVYLNVKVSNSGSDDLRGVSISFIENENFEVAQGSDITKDLGLIPAFSNLESSNNFVIAKYKINVAPGTPIGLNTVKFEVREDGGNIYTYDFDVLVQDENPTIEVTDFNIATVEAGSSENLELVISNQNDIDLKNVIVSLDLDAVEDKVFNLESGSNQKRIALVKSGENKKITYDLVANPDARSRPYLIPVNIKFEDSLGNSFESTVYGSIKVYSKPIISINLDSQDIYTKGRGRVTVSVANPSTSTIKGTQIEVLGSQDYEVLEGKYQYVGDLNPDDFQTVQMDMYINDTEDATLRFKVNYLDSYNVENEEVFEVPLNIYTQEQLGTLGFAGQTGSSNVLIYVIFIVLIVVAYIVGRKRGFKKGKSKK